MEIGIEIESFTIDSVAPPRNTREYRHLLRALEGTAWSKQARWGAIDMMTNLYAAPGVIDLAARWLLVIEANTAPHGPHRNAYGVVQIDTFLKLPERDNPAHALESAALHARRYADTGPAPHELFQEGLEMTSRMWDLVMRWKPYLSAALGAAHHSRNPGPVTAALRGCPHRDDPDQVRHMAVLVGCIAQVAS